MHRDPARDALDDPHDLDGAPPDRHEVDDAHHAVVGVERGLEHERVPVVAAFDGADPAGRRELPAAVLGRAEEGGEHGLGVEAGHAHPVDGAVLAHERGGVRIADECVVLDASGHGRQANESAMTQG